MTAPATILELLARGAGQAPAIGAPGRRPLDYDGLRALSARTVAALNGFGIGRNDPVAIVLPNGPEMATAFVAIAAGATTAPLNPAYREEEFDFYLGDLQARLLVLAEGAEGPALAVARRRGIPVARLAFDPAAPAGEFTLSAGVGRAAAGGSAGGDDIAIVLHTSGTTSRPKIVPLTQRNICASAAHIATSLALGSEDCELNVMPLFHIHGLIAAVLASLSAGASVVCTPGFNALQFYSQLGEVRPTWYTAVPTMHRAILDRAARNAEIIRAARLRFIRSSSASLPPQVMAELEATFGVPVIEAYGMTEAAHQMASNPLPPRTRKPGTVGIAAGPEVAIMDAAGNLLPRHATGEIVIRGPNVTPGYQGNPAANAAAFINGWFRTGDEGVLDEEGYLRITGRLKEIINRGGEKISPREVDEVLLDHPAVAEAICFAVPHEKLGEDIAAAVVLKDGVAVTERELQGFLRGRLADMKVPRRILFLAEIPKGATGKLQRIGLARTLGLG
ncbi:MAG: acyl--CoA ligase [Gammaproteobacteria bacterium]|jgi:acyl-CoA synthetase (AMP-forming)/AMP-acid ligase II|nr:acyl--CoA ligase [Gammaproteobacteria bacterium]